MALAISMTSIANAADDSIKIKTIDGKSIEIIGTESGFHIPAYKGKIVFAEFWGTRCPPCLASIPHYVELQEKYKNNLAILAVEVQGKSSDDLKKFAKANKMNYDVVSHQEGSEFIDYVVERAQWRGSIPFLIILDKEGAVQIIQPGKVPKDVLEGVIEKLLDPKTPKAPTTATPQTKETNTSDKVPAVESTTPAKTNKTTETPTKK